MTIDRAITQVQICYPQIYYACHTRHERKRSSALQLSARDAQILVHLDPVWDTSLGGLARHMDLAASTVSEAVTRLETLGFLEKVISRGGDRRQIAIRLTAKGTEAVRSTSVLETSRLRSLLSRLSLRNRAKVIEGLTILARACRPVIARKQRR